ncbi:unnamed protein product [Amoebophrya sp. A25]|nr:unnamed protein product [Amoebophrya sp. A25]|eukprot:GSA25T00013598001.1
MVGNSSSGKPVFPTAMIFVVATASFCGIVLALLLGSFPVDAVTVVSGRTDPANGPDELPHGVSAERSEGVDDDEGGTDAHETEELRRALAARLTVTDRNARYEDITGVSNVETASDEVTTPVMPPLSLGENNNTTRPVLDQERERQVNKAVVNNTSRPAEVPGQCPSSSLFDCLSPFVVPQPIQRQNLGAPGKISCALKSQLKELLALVMQLHTAVKGKEEKAICDWTQKDLICGETMKQGPHHVCYLRKRQTDGAAAVLGSGGFGRVHDAIRVTETGKLWRRKRFLYRSQTAVKDRRTGQVSYHRVDYHEARFAPPAVIKAVLSHQVPVAAATSSITEGAKRRVWEGKGVPNDGEFEFEQAKVWNELVQQDGRRYVAEHPHEVVLKELVGTSPDADGVRRTDHEERRKRSMLAEIDVYKQLRRGAHFGEGPLLPDGRRKDRCIPAGAPLLLSRGGNVAAGSSSLLSGVRATNNTTRKLNELHQHVDVGPSTNLTRVNREGLDEDDQHKAKVDCAGDAATAGELREWGRKYIAHMLDYHTPSLGLVPGKGQVSFDAAGDSKKDFLILEKAEGRDLRGEINSVLENGWYEKEGLPSDYVRAAVSKLALGSFRQRERLVAKVMLALMRGVAFMHHHDVTHRDLKPENIKVAFSPADPENPDGEVEVKSLKIFDMDLGVLNSQTPDKCKSEPEQLVGTHGYIPPEVYKYAGRKQWTLLKMPFDPVERSMYLKHLPKFDIWSAGQLFWQLLFFTPRFELGPEAYGFEPPLKEVTEHKDWDFLQWDHDEFSYGPTPLKRSSEEHIRAVTNISEDQDVLESEREVFADDMRVVNNVTEDQHVLEAEEEPHERTVRKLSQLLRFVPEDPEESWDANPDVKRDRRLRVLKRPINVEPTPQMGRNDGGVELIKSMMDPNPANRPSAIEVVRILEEYLDETEPKRPTHAASSDNL